MSSLEKINFDEITRDYEILSLTAYTKYLGEIWRDLSRKSRHKEKGIDRITFLKYFGLPGIINERLFSVFDKNKNNYLDPREFIEGMTTLYCETFEMSAKFIFSFYDFNNDKKISKEDVRVVLSYVPLKRKIIQKETLKLNSEMFQERINSQEEIYQIIEEAFGTKKYLDEKEFFKVLQTKSCDIFLLLFMFLLSERPFSNDTINLFIKEEKNRGEYVMEPLDENDQIGYRANVVKEDCSRLIFNRRRSVFLTHLMIRRKISETNQEFKKGKKTVDLRIKNFLGNFKEDSPVNEIRENFHRRSQKKPKIVASDRKKSKSISKFAFAVKDYVDTDEDKARTDTEDFSTEDEVTESSVTESSTRHEGYLYKITSCLKDLKKLYFKIVYKDLYYYSNIKSKYHQGIHNLAGVYVEEHEPILYKGIKLFPFSISTNNKKHFYYSTNYSEYQGWLEKLKKATGYNTIWDDYEMKKSYWKREVWCDSFSNTQTYWEASGNKNFGQDKDGSERLGAYQHRD